MTVPPLARPDMPAPTSPDASLPPSALMSDLGWVAMRSAWAEAARQSETLLLFKSSPFGSYSHSHADQNSFVLEAFGSPLLIDAGNSGLVPSP
jgi:hypothetical protein